MAGARGYAGTALRWSFASLTLASLLLLLVLTPIGGWGARSWTGGVSLEMHALLWRGVIVYWLPFLLLVGVPVHLLLRRRLARKAAAAVALTAAAWLSFASAPVIKQCEASARMRWEVLSELTTEDRRSFHAVHSLDDDFYDDERGFPLSNYCPSFFVYYQLGVWRGIWVDVLGDINHEEYAEPRIPLMTVPLH